MGLVEVKSPHEVAEIYIGDPLGPMHLIQDKDKAKFVMYQFQYAIKKWAFFDNIYEDSNPDDIRAQELIDMPPVAKDKKFLRVAAPIIAVTMYENRKHELSQDEIDYNLFFDKVKNICMLPKWRVESRFPFHIITNLQQPWLLYIVWQWNN